MVGQSPDLYRANQCGFWSRRGARQRSFYGVTIPVILPDHSGVRYYDTTTLDGGHLLMMLTNADWISEKQLREARIKNGEG